MAASAPARVREGRGPATLLPPWVARLVGFAALSCLGIAQWQRMVAGLSGSRALLWVLLAVAAAAAVVACDRLAGRPRGVALHGGGVGGLVVGGVGAVPVEGGRAGLPPPRPTADVSPAPGR